MRVTTTLSLPRQPSSVTRARHVLTTLLSLTDATEEACGHLAVLISEACANAVVHAEPESTVDITIVIDEHACLIEVGNRGSTPDRAGLRAPPGDPFSSRTGSEHAPVLVEYDVVGRPLPHPVDRSPAPGRLQAY
ncbi:hypothetical protein C6361_07045 [Plantactinospora sp. BC1]|uniref:ATP-binding protein n=1 Tax=Plantactinospora sp. BC1 TaxID=2108470 RepID=UPI000D168B7C|nr:ATP-binding protein [Plantactinospora sp. BC1]AVT29288.1 hypothetical protein C6361_07045 [Plantactinospora sp. BC1]